MTLLVACVFVVVYLGMMVGRIPGLAIDRTGVAALGAIALVASGHTTIEEAWQAIDVPTMGLLLGLMVASAQLRLGGLYTFVAQRLARAGAGPRALLMLVIAVTALLSAVLANDIVCLAMTPLLVEGCLRRGLRPLPFLLALACAANIGSAATLIGNPQNMLIGQTLHVPFVGYLLEAIVPTVLGCFLLWAVLARQFRGAWTCPPAELGVAARPLDRWQTCKGLVVVGGTVAAFLFAPWPREIVALAAAGVLLLSRRLHTREMLGLVDWQFLVLFAGLFVVNRAMLSAGLVDRGLEELAGAGIDLRRPGWLFAAVVVLSNLVSNVPAVMLLLPAAVHPQAALVLALGSTLAGNMFIVASIANIIVVDQAERVGVRIGWAEHARTGVPVTLLTLGVTAAWLLLLWLA